DRRDLVAQRLTATGGHQDQRVVAGGDVVDDGGLLAAEGGVAEDLLECPECCVVHAGRVASRRRASVGDWRGAASGFAAKEDIPCGSGFSRALLPGPSPCEGRGRLGGGGDGSR